jgi:hypothetical protein
LAHVQPFECRSAALVIDGARDGLTGSPREVELYAARPYRFGEPRGATVADQTRVVVDCINDLDDDTTRVSLTLGDALRVAAHLTRLVTSVDGPPER